MDGILGGRKDLNKTGGVRDVDHSLLRHPERFRGGALGILRDGWEEIQGVPKSFESDVFFIFGRGF